MPNWCFNCLEISGSKKDLKALVTLVKGKGEDKDTALDFNNIIPYPKTYADQDKNSDNWKGFNNGGYDWCHKNWGTKWNVTAEMQGNPNQGSVAYTFDSAWSPPEPIVKKLSEMFPTLNFELRYEEPGMCFEGELVVKGGVVVSDVCNDMPTYICEECGNEQTEPSSTDCIECWNCGSEDFRLKEEKK